MKKIFVSGRMVLVSDKDFLFLVGYNWCLSNNRYAVARIDGKSQFMHRIIVERMELDLTKGEVDHLDGNPLNNQRKNLRIATRSQNKMNSCCFKNNTSGYKGVCWQESCQKWQAQIQIDGKRIYLGHFDTPEEAHQAYCEAAEKYFGEFARAE